MEANTFLQEKKNKFTDVSYLNTVVGPSVLSPHVVTDSLQAVNKTQLHPNLNELQDLLCYLLLCGIFFGYNSFENTQCSQKVFINLHSTPYNEKARTTF